MSTSGQQLAVVILAAGESRRLGQPKQLLIVDGLPLIRRSIHLAIAAACGPVHVVLGAHREQIEPVLVGEPIRVVAAANWRSGMAASLRAGIDSLPAGSAGALVMLADQIGLTIDSLRRLQRAWQTDTQAIVASQYAGTSGVPTIFPARVYPQLMSLRGERGAQFLTQEDPRLIAVPLPEAEEDLDRPVDLQHLRY